VSRRVVALQSEPVKTTLTPPTGGAAATAVGSSQHKTLVKTYLVVARNPEFYGEDDSKKAGAAAARPFVLTFVSVAQDFVTPVLFALWRKRIADSFARRMETQMWNYATNNDGTELIAGKRLGLDSIAARRSFAADHVKYQPDSFVYARYEMLPKCPLLKELRAFFDAPPFRRSVSSVVMDGGGGEMDDAAHGPAMRDAVANGELRRFSVMAFERGDLIAPHTESDGAVIVEYHIAVRSHSAAAQHYHGAAMAAAPLVADQQFYSFDTKSFTSVAFATGVNQLVVFRGGQSLIERRTLSLQEDADVVTNGTESVRFIVRAAFGKPG
jgi:hypothetical protein